MLKSSGMHPSSTGAPGETSCANAQIGCHSDASITNDNTHIVNTLIYSTADSSYVPGQTYTVTLQAQKPGMTKVGFGIVALRNSNNTNSGSWGITEAARTHTISGTGGLSSRRYVTHNITGNQTISIGLGQWSFNWTAPATDVGNITFYYATNCTNNSGDEMGDAIFLSSFQIHPYSGNSIHEWIKEGDFQAILNPSLNELVLHYELIKECELSVNLFDAQGKIIKRVDSSKRTRGIYSDRIDLSQDINTGIYFVHISINDQTLTKKIMIQ